MICNNCNVVMRFVMRFDGKNMYRLRRCPQCYYETKQVPLFLDDETIQNNSRKEERKDHTKRTPRNQKKVNGKIKIVFY